MDHLSNHMLVDNGVSCWMNLQCNPLNLIDWEYLAESIAASKLICVSLC